MAINYWDLPGVGMLPEVEELDAFAVMGPTMEEQIEAHLEAGDEEVVRQIPIAAAGILPGRQEFLTIPPGQLPPPAPISPGAPAAAVSTALTTQYNGIATGPALPAGTPDDLAATPMAFPLVAAVAAPIVLAAGRYSIYFLRTLFTRFGPKVLKLMIGAAAFKELMDLIGIGAPDWTLIQTQTKKRRKRYSIGANPRVGTLAKVAKHTMRLLKRHDKIIRQFLPPRRGLPAKALARTYLSTAERKQLKEGG